MLSNRKIKNAIVYCVAGLLGLCCVAWLLTTLKNVPSDPIDQFQVQGEPPVPDNLSSDDKPSLNRRLSIQRGGVISANDGADSGQCSVRCNSALSMLDENVELDDETFHKLEAYVKEIAAYLQSNERKRQHYLEMALITTDSDKRAFLTDIFRHLPYQQKVEISASFIGSERWRLRADGVTLIAEHDGPNLDVGRALMAIFLSEENSYIKGRILRYVKQDLTLQGDTELLLQLDSAIYNDADSSVRVAALNAKMQLSEQPYHILPDALQALRTSEPELQFAGMIAIEQVLEHEKKYIESGAYIDRNSIKEELQMIRNLVVYDDDKKRSGHLIGEANLIYMRYFN